MVSRTSLTCNHYAAGCTKTSTKILHQKNSKKEENAPDSARKRRNRVRFGCWRGWQRLGTDKTRCEKPKFEPKRTPFPCTTCKKKPGRNTVFPPGLWQGQKDLNPRHAVLEWMWASAPGSGRGPVSPGSCRKPERGRCWFGAASYFWRRIVHRLPLLPSKEKHLPQEDGQADQDHGRVGPGSVQLRHRVEIHAVPTSN